MGGVDHEQLERLVDLVARMRGYQRAYFKYKRFPDLVTAREYERKVDELIDAISSPTLFRDSTNEEVD